MFRMSAVIAMALVTSLVPSHGAYAYGAIAIATSNGASYGMTWNNPSQTTANADAILQCNRRAKSGAACTIIAMVTKQCGAVAGTETRPGTPASYFGATGAKLPVARLNALLACTKNGAKCQVVVSGCDTAKGR